MQARMVRLMASALVIAGVLTLQPGVGAGKAQALDYARLTTLQQRLLSGFAAQELNPQHSAQAQAATRNNYVPSSDDGCPQNLGADVKVNQNCLNVSDPDLQGRAQAHNETTIAQDPMHPDHLVAGYNDYRRGDGNCYGAYSLDGGKNWTDTTIPMSFTRGTAFGTGIARQYWQAGGDPAVAWDTRGNAYYQCQMFQRGSPTTPNADLSSAVYVFRSTGNFGASWNFPARPVIESADVMGTGTPPFEDKPYMTVDNHTGSPFRDRVYVTYTEFTSTGTADIYESYSADFGETFSARVLVSSTSTLCPGSVGTSGSCDANQYSQPFTGPDGALYVVFANFNNALKSANDNRNQMLLAKSTDGGKSFGPLVKVADYYDLPDCATYQGGKDPGRACVPEKGPGANSYFRAANYPSGAVNPTKSSQVAVTFGSYINVHSNETNGCIPAKFAPDGNNVYTGVKNGTCNNDILLSVSNDGGKTFTGTTGTAADPRLLTSVTTAPRQARSDQFFQWAAFSQGGKLAVSYYDRQYGDDETTGFSDISVSGSDDLAHFGVQRVTTASMPPPTEFSGTFFGDYSGLTAVDDAHPLWMDTRNPDRFLCPGTGTPMTPPAICKASASNASIANNEDIFTRAIAVPSR